MDSRLVAANRAFEQGRNGEAVDRIIAALEGGVAPDLRLYTVLLRNLLELGRDAKGADWAAKAVDWEPGSAELLNFLGAFLSRTGDGRAAIAAYDRAIAIAPDDEAALANKGHVLTAIGEGRAAEAIFSRLVAAHPGSADYQRAMGRALIAQGHYDAAMVRLREAVALKSDDVEAWLELAGLAVAQSNHAEAQAMIDRALAVSPDEIRLMQAKARIWRGAGELNAAEAYLQSLLPRFERAAWLHHEIAVTIAGMDLSRAILHHCNAVELAPDMAAYHIALAGSLERARGPAEGANLDAAYEVLRGIALPSPLGSHEAKIAVDIFTRVADYGAVAALGSLRDIGRMWAANGYHSALLKLLPWARSADDRRELIAQHRIWGKIAADTARRAPISFPASARPGAKIRLGFLSSDLREHPVAYFSLPLFEHVDRDRFEIHCYSFYRGEVADAVQQRIAGLVDCFRWHPDISDRDAAQMIANDQIDMLFELGGATDMNKIEVMAWKPARITASWLGYPHSSGLDTIDYLLVNPQLNPPDPELLIEQPLIMPQSWIMLSPHAFPEDHAIEPVAPVGRNGFITFGTANNPYKYGAEMIAGWARIVAAVPGSRFLFVRPEGGSQAFVRNIRAGFAAEGVSADRIEFRAVQGTHMAHYNDIDIALDTFPQTGGTTTCEAAWMGVPTVTLVGEALFERLSYSILHTAGLDELCAGTIAAYHDIAVGLAADHDRIQTLRTGLRAQLKASPLGQNEQFARDFFDLVARTVEANPSAMPGG